MKIYSKEVTICITLTDIEIRNLLRGLEYPKAADIDAQTVMGTLGDRITKELAHDLGSE